MPAQTPIKVRQHAALPPTITDETNGLYLPGGRIVETVPTRTPYITLPSNSLLSRTRYPAGAPKEYAIFLNLYPSY